MECCKVGSVAEKYDLVVSAEGRDVHDYLTARWTGEDGYPETGVRKLADWFNERVIRAAYVSNGRTATDVRIRSEYEALTEGDAIERQEVVDDLSADGIDGEELAADFVSRSTVRRHLVNCLGAEKADPGRSDSGWELERIDYSKDRLRENIDDAVRSLSNKGELPGGTSADVEVAVFLSCPECSRQVRLRTAIERGYVCRDHLGGTPPANAELTDSLD